MSLKVPNAKRTFLPPTTQCEPKPRSLRKFVSFHASDSITFPPFSVGGISRPDDSLLDRDGNVLPSPVLVNVRVKLELPHAKTRHEPRPRDTEHELPDALERLAKRLPHLVLQRLLERRDRGNRRKCKLDALWELREERGGQFLLQLVLQDRTADGDAPYLRGASVGR